MVLIISVLIAVIITLIKYYISGLKTRYSRIKQVLEGFIKVIIPILILLGLVIWFKVEAEWILSQTNILIELLLVFLVSEGIAIVINPLPKWAFDNNVEGLSEIADKIFNKEESK